MKNVIITLCFVITSTIVIAQGKAIKFSKDANSYYQTDFGSILQFTLPDLDKKTIVKKEELIPTGKTSALSIKSYSFNSEETKVLIFTNSRKVWRYDTRGDYWVFDIAKKKLQKLGTSLPSSSLMFAKFSPDGTKVAYVSKHNIYLEDINNTTYKRWNR